MQVLFYFYTFVWYDLFCEQFIKKKKKKKKETDMFLEQNEMVELNKLIESSLKSEKLFSERHSHKLFPMQSASPILPHCGSRIITYFVS